MQYIAKVKKINILRNEPHKMQPAELLKRIQKTARLHSQMKLS